MDDRQKQVEEMAKVIEQRCNRDCIPSCDECIAQTLYNAGYRKQIVGEWKDNHCTNCGMMPLGEEMWTTLDLLPPKFEWFMDYCPICGARMKGGEGK